MVWFGVQAFAHSLILLRAALTDQVFGPSHSSADFNQLSSSQCNLSFFTLKLPFAKLYICCDADVVHAIEKMPLNVAMIPVEKWFMHRLTGLDLDDDMQQSHFFAGHSPDERKRGRFAGFLQVGRGALKPGPEINEWTKTTAAGMAEIINGLAEDASGPLDVWHFVRRRVTMVKTNVFFGSLNPLKKKEVEEAFW